MSGDELGAARAPRASTQHKASDFYSKENPVPSIQRFFNKALSEVLANADRSDDEGEETDGTVVEQDDESGDDTPTNAAEGKRKKRLSQVFRKGGKQGEAGSSKQCKESKRKRERVVHDPITDNEITVHNVSRTCVYAG